MSAVDGVAKGAPPTTPASTVSSTDPEGAPSVLLPPPGDGALAGSDPLSVLYLLESQGEASDTSESTGRIQGLQAERQDALRQEQDAIQAATDASKQHGFWDSLGGVLGEVGKVAAVVASVAAAVATLGAATPIAAVAIAGAVLSSASFVEGEFHVLNAMGVADATARWIDVGMSVGGMAASMGSALLAGGQAASQAVSAVRTAATVTGGVAQAGAGVSDVAAGEARAADDRAAAKEAMAQSHGDQIQRWVQMLLTEAQSSNDESEHALRAIANAKTTQADTAVAAASAVRG